MQDLMQPLIHKAALRDITVHIARTGLSIGDEVKLSLQADGRIRASIEKERRLFGFLWRHVTVQIGLVGPEATALLSEAVGRGESLRVRIVGLTPEYLTQNGQRPEIHISVWGDPRKLTQWIMPPTAPLRQNPDAPAAAEPESVSI